MCLTVVAYLLLITCARLYFCVLTWWRSKPWGKIDKECIICKNYNENVHGTLDQSERFPLYGNAKCDVIWMEFKKIHHRFCDTKFLMNPVTVICAMFLMWKKFFILNARCRPRPSPRTSRTLKYFHRKERVQVLFTFMKKGFAVSNYGNLFAGTHFIKLGWEKQLRYKVSCWRTQAPWTVTARIEAYIK